MQSRGALIVNETIGQPHRNPPGARPHRDPVDWENISRLIAASGEVAGRTLLSDDPALGFDQHRPPLNGRSLPVPDRPDRPHRPSAVLLIEPADALMAWNPVTNRRRDLLAEL